MTIVDEAESWKQNRTIGATRRAGIILMIASLIALFAIIHHPTGSGHSHEQDELAMHVESTQSLHRLNMAVHATMIVVVGAFVLSTSYLSSLLGFERYSVRGATIAYAFGGLCMAVAATVDGFVFLRVMERAVEDAQQRFVIDSIAGVLLDFMRVMGLMGVFWMSIGVSLWSLGMLQQTEPWKLSGLVGFCVAAIAIAGVSTGHLEATVHGMIAFVAIQLVWNMFVGVQLVRLTCSSPNANPGSPRVG